MLLDNALDLAPSRMEISVFEDLAEIPPYNADVAELGDPPSVASLKDAIGLHDALLVASPEYNFGIPGVLKNAFDWASTPPGQSVLGGRTAALLGASAGMLGTARCQHLRELFIFTGTYSVLQPEALITRAARRFDDSGRLTDDIARSLVRQLLENLEDLTRRLRPEDAQVT
jgi:chromate reductase